MNRWIGMLAVCSLACFTGACLAESVAAAPKLLPSSTDDVWEFSDGSSWDFEAGSLLRAEPAPQIEVIVQGPHYVGRNCAAGRRGGYPLHPVYAPSGYGAAPENRDSDGNTEVDVCTDIPGGALDVRLRWPGKLSADDARSITGPLAVIRSDFLNAPAEREQMQLFSPPLATVTMDATTGSWAPVDETTTATETVIIATWPAETGVVLSLRISANAQACSTTGIESSPTLRPEWLPASLHPKAIQRDGLLSVCGELAGRALIASFRETAVAGNDYRLRVRALLAAILAAK